MTLSNRCSLQSHELRAFPGSRNLPNLAPSPNFSAMCCSMWDRHVGLGSCCWAAGFWQLIPGHVENTQCWHSPASNELIISKKTVKTNGADFVQVNLGNSREKEFELCPEGAAKYQNDLMENWILVALLLKMALSELWMMVFQKIPKQRRLGNTTWLCPIWLSHWRALPLLVTSVQVTNNAVRKQFHWDNTFLAFLQPQVVRI